MTGTGYSESAQVSMYNTYQNRVATARESYQKAVMEYDNAMKEAMLQNNTALAEIAYTALQKKLELSLEGFQYKNQLLMEQQNQKTQIDDRYYSRYQDVINQMNYENEMEEQIRQYEQNYQLQIKQFDEQIRQYEQEYAFQIKQFDESIRQFDAEMARLKAKDAQEHAAEIQRLQLQRDQLEESKRQADMDYQLSQQQLKAQKEQAQKEHLLDYKRYQLEKENSGSGYHLLTADELMYGAPDEPEDQTIKGISDYGSYGNGQPKGIKDPDNGKSYKLKSTSAEWGYINPNNGRYDVEYTTIYQANGKFYYWDRYKGVYQRLYYNDTTQQFQANVNRT
jgi:hypothetical protein